MIKIMPRMVRTMPAIRVRLNQFIWISHECGE
jgi:hypothetical protein